MKWIRIFIAHGLLFPFRGWLLSIFIIAIVVAVSGCMEQSTKDTHFPSPTSSYVSTSQPIILTVTDALDSAYTVITNTPEPTCTRVSTWTPHPILTKTPAITRVPTLSAIEQEARIFELVESNGECLFPCFWGIIPTATDFQTAKDMMDMMKIRDLKPGLSSGFVWHQFNITPLSRQDGVLGFSVDFYEDQQTGVIQTIKVDIRPELVTLQAYEVLGVYALNEILLAYGEPSGVSIMAEFSHSDPTAGFFAAVSVFYDDLNFAVQYAIQGASEVDDNVLICPQYDNVDWISLILSPNELPSSMNKFGPYEAMLGDVSNMTIDDFINAFRTPDIETCIESPAELWR